MMRFIKKFGILCLIIVILFAWYQIWDRIFDASGGVLLSWNLLGLAVKEEIIFRWIPILLSTAIIVLMRKKQVRWQIPIFCFLALFVLIVQLVFALVHLPWDPLYREMVHELPASPTYSEILGVISNQGVMGVGFCISYFITISKNKPLHLLQLYSLISSSFVHFILNTLIIFREGSLNFLHIPYNLYVMMHFILNTITFFENP